MLRTTDPPLRYVEHAVTMAEVPLEISLTISISNCAFRCHGCHSQYLQEDVGKPLLPDLESLIDRYKGLISCVCLMGEGRNTVE
jgi:anaerobic ribonucleoside-triphosphate reductase activating protein